MNTKSFLKSDIALILLLALIKLFIHLYTNAFAGYGIFRDEFYYIACSNRLDLGYVDHPPFSIYVLTISRFLFGESQFGLRLLPAIISATIVFLTGLLTKKLGGNKFAIVLACICVIASPVLLGMFLIYSMNPFDHLFWILSIYIIVLIVKDQKPKYWIYLGIVLGLGLLNKVGILWLCAGISFGIILTPLRSSLKTRYPYIAAAIALIIFLPFIIWNITHDFAHVEFIRNASQIKYGGLTRTDFVIEQIMIHHPVTVFVWLSGLYFFFFNKEGKAFRILGIIYLVSFLILFINGKNKGEYLAAIYPMLFAGGGVLFEKIVAVRYLVWVKYVLPALIIIGGIITLPVALPILPVESYIAYSKTIGVAPSTAEGHELTELPQFYADMFGWEELARDVSEVYQKLPDEEKASTIVFALNYGEAGALEYFSKKYPLPEVVSPHNNYWIWGYPKKDIKTVIVLGGNREDHLESCESVEVAAIHKCKYCMSYENNLPLFICKGLKRSIEEIWQTSKFFI